MDALTRNWLLLIGFVGATLALAALDGRLAAAGLLALAWLKARAILGGFLHLKAAPGWLSAALLPLAIWLFAIWGLYALALR